MNKKRFFDSMKQAIGWFHNRRDSMTDPFLVKVYNRKSDGAGVWRQWTHEQMQTFVDTGVSPYSEEKR